MSLKICILGSGSSGNCTYVASSKTRVLIDAGLSGKSTLERLGQIDACVEDLQAICLSHEHNDHTAGLRVLHKRHHVPVYANAGTIEGVVRRDRKYEDMTWNIFTTGVPFIVGDLTIESFSVPHDAYDPVGFVVSQGDTKVGVVMDMGMPTQLVRQQLKVCQAVVVEANHDEELLQDAERPWFLKQRIRSRQGHLSNTHAAEMIADIAGPHLSQVYLAHLSEDCNRHDLALETAERSLKKRGHTHVKVSLTFPDRVSEVWSN